MGFNKEDAVEYNGIPDYSVGCPECPQCGTTMGYSHLKQEFKCPECDYIMHEDDWECGFDFDDPDNPPFGCDACGGPWPHCKTSCKMFDD